MVVRRVLGMSSLAEAEDRSFLRDSKAATGCSWSARYGGVIYCRTREINIEKILMSINGQESRTFVTVSQTELNHTRT